MKSDRIAIYLHLYHWMNGSFEFAQGPFDGNGIIPDGKLGFFRKSYCFFTYSRHFIFIYSEQGALPNSKQGFAAER